MAWTVQRRLSYETQESVSDLFNITRKRTVVFILPKISHKEEPLLYMAHSASQLGHNVHIITNRCAIYLPTFNTPNMKLHVVGTFIPETIKGFLGDVLHVVGSLYACIWLLFKQWGIRPNFVVTQGPLTILPVLKQIGNFHIVHFYSFNELNCVTPGTYVPNSSFEESRLIYADEIIISSKVARSLFREVFPNVKSPIVFYHCLDRPNFDGCCPANISSFMKVTSDAVIYVCFGSMTKSSNFELAIEAFSSLLDLTRRYDPMSYINLFLVIASNFENTPQYSTHQKYLRNLAQKLCKSRSSVIFMNNSTLSYRKSLLQKSLAVIYPITHETCFDYKVILEANYMGKPVIGPNCGIANEFIIHGINGFLVPPLPLEISKCMRVLLYNYTMQQELSYRSHTYFHQNYSEVRYAYELQGLIARNSAE